MRRWWVTVGLIMAVGLGVARVVLAHAALVSADPPANAALMRAPEQIVLTFTEPLEPDFSTITLRNAGGDTIQTPASVVDSSDLYRMTLAPGDLPDGLYTVAWRALSSADGHVTQGSYAFTIGIVETTGAVASAAQDVIPADGAIIRWLDLMTSSLVVGGIGFWLFVWSPAGPANAGVNAFIEERMHSLLWLAWTLLGVTGLLMLMLQISVAADVPLAGSLGPDSLWPFLQTTRYGHLWLARMALWLALGVVLGMAQARPRLLWGALVLGGGLLLTRSLFSHAAVAPDAAAAIAGDWLHLTMTTFWLGGLAQFLNVLVALRRGGSPVGTVATLALHFTNYGRVAVAGLIITGVYAAWLQVGTVEALVTTRYGQALLVKLILLLPLLAIAAFNLVITGRGLRAGQAGWTNRLRALVGVEIALLTGILVAVGVMTSINPARNVVAAQQQAAAQPANTAFFQMQLADTMHVHLDISPGTVGQNAFVVDMYEAGGAQVTNATTVLLRFTNLDQPGSESSLRLEAQEDGTYRADGLNLSTPGRWRIRTTVQRPDAFDAVVDFEPTVSVAAPPPVTDTAVPLPDRTLALLLTGLVALIIGGFFAGSNRAPLWRGMGLVATTMVIVGMVFLVSGVMML